MSIPYLPGLLDDSQQLPRPGYTPTAAPTPTPTPMPPSVRPITVPLSPKRTSLFDRFKQALLPTPPGMDGLLSPDAEDSARHAGMLNMGLSLLDSGGPVVGGPAPSLGQALARGINAGRAGMDANAQQSVQGGLLQDDLERKNNIEQARQQIMRAFPPQPNETQDQTAARLSKIYSASVQAGDMETAGKLTEVMKTIFARTPERPVPLEHIDLGDRVAIYDPASKRQVGTWMKGAVPKTPAEVDAATKYRADQSNKILDDFRADTKDFHQEMNGWETLRGASQNPTLATPLAVMDAYAKITNPTGQIRPTMVEMIHDLGSVGQRMEKFWEKNTTGSLPPDILKDFTSTLYNIVKRHKVQYDQVRDKAITRAKGAGVDITPYLQDYSLEDPNAPPPGASTVGRAAAVRQFLKKR